MYIKYKSLKDGKISIINVSVQSYDTITTESDYLCFNVIDKESKVENIRLKLSTNENAIKSLERLYQTLGFKKPIGDILDLTSLDEELIIEENEEQKEGIE